MFLSFTLKQFLFNNFSVDPVLFKKNSCKKITITYEDNSYVICMSNKKIYIVKKKNPLSTNQQTAIVPEGNLI